MVCLFKGVKESTISNSLQVEYHKIVVKLCKFGTNFHSLRRLVRRSFRKMRPATG